MAKANEAKRQEEAAAKAAALEKQKQAEKERRQQEAAAAAAALEKEKQAEKERQAEKDRREEEAAAEAAALEKQRQAEKDQQERDEAETRRLAELEEARRREEAADQQRRQDEAAAAEEDAAKQRLDDWLRSAKFAGVNDKRKSMMKAKFPLHSAVKRKDLETIQLLLRFGADPTNKDSSGLTPKDLAEKMKDKSMDAIVQALSGPVVRGCAGGA